MRRAGGLVLDASLPYTGRHDFATGAYAETVVRVGPRFEVTPGIRVDLFASRGRPRWPSIPASNACLALPRQRAPRRGPRARLAAAEAVVPLPGFQQSLAGGLQRTSQASIGVEATLPEAFEATVTLFQDTFFNLTDPAGHLDGHVERAQRVRHRHRHGSWSTGWSAGVEIGLRRRLTRHLGGILSYTLSRSARGSGWGQASEYDRTHVVSVATLYDFGHGIKGGTRILGYSGSPYWGLVRTPPGSYPTRSPVT